MIELSDYSPEFRHTWHLRLQEEFVCLADSSFQREVWIEASRPGVMHDYVELMCGLFDDEQVETFLILYRDWLNKSVYSAMNNALRLLDQFGKTMTTDEQYQPSHWIDTPPWRECVRAGELILQAIEQDGWWTDSRQRLD